MPEKDLHGFLIFGKMCKITSKKLEKCEKNKKKIQEKCVKMDLKSRKNVLALI